MDTVEVQIPAVPADKEPYLAACLILLDRSVPAEPRVLLGRRHRDHIFLPGKFVFPGGRNEPEDAQMQSLGMLSPAALRLRNPAAGRPIASPESLALTAVRELFEETGLMLGERASSPITAPGSASWAQFAAAGVLPNLLKLHYVARALTPPGLPRRFDTHFFAANAVDIVETVAGFVHDGAELVELRWVTLGEVAALDILPITQVITTELARRLRTDLDHDDFGLNQSKIMNVIDSNNLERDAGGKPVPTFPHPALGPDLPVPFFYMQDDRWIRAEF